MLASYLKIIFRSLDCRKALAYQTGELLKIAYIFLTIWNLSPRFSAVKINHYY